MKFLVKLDLWLMHKPVTHLQTSTKQRVLFIDQIKALMIALVIAGHVLNAFVFDWGFYGVHIPSGESHHPLFGGVAIWCMTFLNTFYMYMLFLLSGYFVPRSVQKKGIRQYLSDRLLRLGIPFLVGLLIINNVSMLLGKLSPSSPFTELPWRAVPLNHLGVLWFLVVLFAFDLLYCLWVAIRGERFSVDASVAIPKLRSWLISAVVLAFIEVVMAMQGDFWAVLLRSPLDGLGAQGSHVVTYAFLFFLGCRASAHRWFEQLDAHLVMRWFRLSIVLAVSVLTISLVLTFSGTMTKELGKFFLLMNLLNPFIGWGMMAYLLLWFQRNQHRYGPWLANAGVDSFGAYIIHPLVLVLVLEAIGFIGLNPWLIAPAAMSLGIVISFGVNHQLRRIPVLARVI